jgi:hypothetical protein
LAIKLREVASQTRLPVARRELLMLRKITPGATTISTGELTNRNKLFSI